MYGVRQKPDWVRGRKRADWQQQEGTPTLVCKLLKGATLEHSGGGEGFWNAWKKKKRARSVTPLFLLYLSTALHWRQVREGSAGAKKSNSPGVLIPPCTPLNRREGERRRQTGGDENWYVWGVPFPLYLASSLLSSLLLRMGWEPSAGCWTQLLSWSPTRQPGVSLSVRRQHIQ